MQDCRGRAPALGNQFKPASARRTMLQRMRVRRVRINTKTCLTGFAAKYWLSPAVTSFSPRSRLVSSAVTTAGISLPCAGFGLGIEMCPENLAGLPVIEFKLHGHESGDIRTVDFLEVVEPAADHKLSIRVTPETGDRLIIA